MPQLEAGFGKMVITPRVGVRLMGYVNRPGPSVGVHDDLHARALVVKAAETCWALCSVDFCYVRESTVAMVRDRVAERTDIPPGSVCIVAVHTHSGPDDHDAESWERPLEELIADAILEAHHRLTPARIGAGFGVLYGRSINRRWLERPVDPALGVIRVDNAEGRPLGMVVNFGCHAVVLGYDNLLISADWPGYAAGQIEAALGGKGICLITQGGSGDVNPLTSGVRARLQDGQAITSGLSAYHGPTKRDGDAWNIYDRAGGTFEEAAEIGQAVAEEALRVARGVETVGEVEGVWAVQATVNGARRPDAPAFPMPPWPGHLTERPHLPPDDATIPLEVMALGIDGPGILLVGQPGEVFAETAVTTRKALQLQGYRFPLLLGYANGWQAYLPPFEAFLEGGYEPQWPLLLGIDPRVQEYLWEGVLGILHRDTTTNSE